jgi:hypothetical protein
MSNIALITFIVWFTCCCVPFFETPWRRQPARHRCGIGGRWKPRAKEKPRRSGAKSFLPRGSLSQPRIKPRLVPGGGAAPLPEVQG